MWHIHHKTRDNRRENIDRLSIKLNGTKAESIPPDFIDVTDKPDLMIE